jgi:hypothetical protein
VRTPDDQGLSDGLGTRKEQDLSIATSVERKLTDSGHLPSAADRGMSEGLLWVTETIASVSVDPLMTGPDSLSTIRGELRLRISDREIGDPDTACLSCILSNIRIQRRQETMTYAS